jgi:DNA-binding NtrC family response regulator
MAADFGTTLSSLPSELAGEKRYYLAVIAEGAVHSAPLPSEGRIGIGRAEQNEVWIDDPTMSRNHAVLYAEGDRFRLEDLGAANGTSVGERRLRAQEIVELRPGQIFELASTMFVIQRRETTKRARRLWPHGYLEMRLEEELSRGRPRAFAASVLWIAAADDAAEDAVEDALAEVLEPSDVAARWADREYEVLLFDGASRVETLKRRLTELLADVGATFGIASAPAHGNTAEVLLAHAREAAHPREELESARPIVEDAVMRDLYRLAEKIARGKISVLVLGETGAGKEVLAAAIHAASARAGGPYLKLNCAAFSDTLLEGELFGYEKGAFTGADRAKPGLLEAAEGGTIFLDEVGEMRLETQVKLLRALEQREVLRLGALKPRSFDVRFVAATNRDLEEEILRGSFRKDLYFRLAGAVLTVPPLRERKSELLTFALRFARSAAEEAGLRAPVLSREVREALLAYAWPGNLRELKNVIERAVLLCGEGPILAEHLPLEKMNARWLEPPAEAKAGRDLSDSELGERDRLVQALEQCGGNQSRAAKMLDMPRRTFLRRVEKYDLPRPRKDQE